MNALKLIPFHLAFLGVAAGGEAVQAQQPTTPPARIVEVKMLDDRYEPANIDVRRGDVVRFLQVGVRKHNVEFRTRGAPAGFDFGPQRRGPYLLRKGETYDVRIDERFQAGGAYPFLCTPHSVMMKGRIRVED